MNPADPFGIKAALRRCEEDRMLYTMWSPEDVALMSLEGRCDTMRRVLESLAEYRALLRAEKGT